MVNPVSPLGGTLTPDDLATLNAIRRYEERLAKDPTSLAFAPLADAYRKGGRARDAIRLCREGLERFPQYVTARLILAKALVDDGNPDGALDEVRAILANSPQPIAWPATCTGVPAPWATPSSTWSRRCGSIPEIGNPAPSSTYSGRAARCRRARR